MAGSFLEELLAEPRKMFPKDDPQLAAELAPLGYALLRGNDFAEAEALFRECLTIREKALPDYWGTYTTKSMLGKALLGQKKLAEAEPLLLQGFDGMKRREKTIPAASKVFLIEAALGVVQLYEAKRNADEAVRWRRELEAIKAAQKRPGQK